MLRNNIAILLISILCNPVMACTNITLKAKDNTVVVARTLEFAPDLKSEILTGYVGQPFGNIAFDDNAPKKWTGKYGFMYLNGFGHDFVVDGMNDQGLSFGYLYLPGYTTYAKPTEDNQKTGLSYIQLGGFVLSQYKNVAEVKKALTGMLVFDQPISAANQPKVTFPLHAIITDKSGNSIVVEFINGKTVIYDDALGIMTNSPTFDWQTNNLKNYTNLSPYSPNSVVMDGINYSANGQGAGMLGLPGDMSPPSRFVKMSVLSTTAEPVDNAQQAVNLAKYIIGTVFIPKGLIRGSKENKSATLDTTQWTVVKDLTNHVLYFSSYHYPTLQAIHLDKLDLSKPNSINAMSITNPSPSFVDITDKLKK